jgi:hypothetical protein
VRRMPPAFSPNHVLIYCPMAGIPAGLHDRLDVKCFVRLEIL